MTIPAAPPEFDRQVAALGLDLEPADRARLHAFLERLYEENAVMNLTRVRPEQAWMRHVFDSLTLVPWLASLRQDADAQEQGRRLLDVGSGGGLPGVPLAIVMSSIDPGTSITLLEATGKKARFLDRLVAGLGLERVRIVAERAERAAHDRANHRERFDAVVSRAVGALPVLAELTLPFARPGGFVMVIKGAQAMQELESARHAIGLLGGAFVEAQETPTGTLLRFEKVFRTPRVYPRAPGEPARRPLLRRRGAR